MNLVQPLQEALSTFLTYLPQLVAWLTSSRIRSRKGCEKWQKTITTPHPKLPAFSASPAGVLPKCLTTGTWKEND